MKLFRRADIVTAKDPDIRVVSKNQKIAAQQKYKADFFATYASDVQDPDASEIGKLMIKRKAKELQGYDRDEILAMFPKSADEIQAWADVDIINE